MPKISIIIPVYNAEEYLKRCLNSIVNQTLKDIEIICVNDCSIDNSLEILNSYAQRDNRIKVIDCKTNGGESKARNIGLDNSTGEFLAFVDNDDELDLDFYEKLYKKAIEENADIAKAEVHIIDYTQKDVYPETNALIKKNNSALYFTFYWWTAIYKSSLIKENNIRLIENYPLGGDVLFLNEAILKTNKLTLVDDTFYHYHRREDSGDSKILPFEKVKSALEIHGKIIDNILANKNRLDSNGIQYVCAWCFKAAMNYAYRNKTIENLEYCIDKAFNFYNKTKIYLIDIENDPKFLPIILNFFKTNNKKELINFFIQNPTPQKKFIANLRYMHTQGEKNA